MDEFTRHINDAVENMCISEKHEKGDLISICVPVPRGFIPTANDIDLDNVLIKKIEDGKLLDKTGKVILDADVRGHDLYKVTGNVRK